MNKKEHITKILEYEFLTDGWCETSTGFESMGYAIEDVIEKIMDQTCGNCKHFTRLNRHGYKCSSEDSCVSGCVSKDFGCNKWKPK